MTRATFLFAVAVTAVAVAARHPAVAQNVIAQHRCTTQYQGMPINGVLSVERWSHHDTHRVYGQFQDARGTLYELEVFTNQPGGVGGMWVNHARHRETRIHLQMVSNGFVVQMEDGGVVQFVCR
jgi:hypothetical protein